MMDDYKYRVAERVHQMALLWDPQHSDYKNKDQRQQAWEKLEDEFKPYKQGVSVKQTWEALNRAFNNAMSRRKHKKSISGQSDDKPWKFEAAMSFLKVVKEKRNTTSNLEDDDHQHGGSGGEETILEHAIDESDIFYNDEDDGDSSAQLLEPKQISQKPSSKTKVPKRKATDGAHDDGRAGLYRIMTQHMQEKHKSPRLKFFESIMPQVDAMTDDCFLDFQISVLTCLKRSGESNAHA